MAYADLLKDPRWQRLRLEVMDRAGFKCELCGNGKLELNIHHKRYRAGAKPWEYELPELLCICLDCHQKLHGITPAIVSAVSEEPEPFRFGRYDHEVLVGAVNKAMREQLTVDDFEGCAAKCCFVCMVEEIPFPDFVMDQLEGIFSIAARLKPGDYDKLKKSVNNRRLKMIRNDIKRRLSGATPEEVRELAIELRENDRRRHEGVRS